MIRLNLKLILPLLVILLAAAGCGSKTLRNVTRQHITRSSGRTPLRRSYNQLTKGMTEAEVITIMGPPTRKKATEKNGYSFTVYTYVEDNWKAVVAISPTHGLLVAHSSDDADFGK